jgi:hypothetical protein
MGTAKLPDGFAAAPLLPSARHDLAQLFRGAAVLRPFAEEGGGDAAAAGLTNERPGARRRVRARGANGAQTARFGIEIAAARGGRTRRTGSCSSRRRRFRRRGGARRTGGTALHRCRSGLRLAAWGRCIRQTPRCSSRPRTARRRLAAVQAGTVPAVSSSASSSSWPGSRQLPRRPACRQALRSGRGARVGRRVHASSDQNVPRPCCSLRSR